MFRALINITQLSLLTLALVACGQQKHEVPLTTGGDTPDPSKPTQQKPTVDVPPNYSETQFKIGQWIEWKNTNPKSPDCLRWKIANITSAGVLIEGRISRKCETPDNSWVESIFFVPSTGLVLSDQIQIQGVPNPEPGALKGKKIFSYLYGASEKVEFTTGTWAMTKTDKLPAFNIVANKGQYFYNNPGHAFHAFALTVKNESTGQLYRYLQSEPTVEFLPNNP